MVSLRVPPTFMPCTPSSQPLMTLARAERKHERVVAVLARIELLAVGEPAGVVHGDVLAGGGCGAVADDDVFDDQAAGVVVVDMATSMD